VRYTFNLKNSKSSSDTPIFFSTYFKDEGRKFVYSTGEKINPKEWDFKLRIPNNTTGRSSEAEKHRTIKQQLDRYSSYFLDLVGRYKNINEPLDIETTRNHFDKHFKKTKPKSNRFFEVYEIFLDSKKNDKSGEANTSSTIKRYEYNKDLLQSFQAHSKRNLNLNKFDSNTYNLFLDYCITVKNHSSNTLRRNVGLLKTFLNWALENAYTHNISFKSFKTPTAFVTDEVALTMDQVNQIYEKDFSKNKKLEKVRDLFVFGCSTGMRYGNYSKVRAKDIIDNCISVIDNKDQNKQLKIPLNKISKAILEKYNYQLPVISSQKFNVYIKEAIGDVDDSFKEEIKKTTKIGNKIIEEDIMFCDRISSHTARRSFITIMKNKKIPDKIIMEFTGHKSLEIFNKYYKPNEEDKNDFMSSVWNN